MINPQHESIAGLHQRIHFPAVAISRENSFALVHSIEDLTGGTARAVALFYPTLHLYDASGMLWPVVEVIPARTITFIDRLFNRRVGISLRFGEPQTAALPVVTSWLIALLSRSGDLYDQYVPIPETVAALGSSSTPQAVLRVVEACLNGPSGA